MTATDQKLAEMIEFARQGGEIIPMFFQPRVGRSNTVSAAIRKGLKTGQLVKAGVDGLGKPTYTIPTPAATHAAPQAVQ
jgi:hypothetical protein